ncbi:MAG: hypothetical protein IJC05_01465 [Phascolarctobacterium sp.]|nr:hypothetical protein [Phascolarctobacterium sp.]
MNLEERKQAIYRLTDCSPLEASKIIQELELYDQENAQEVIDRITEEMKGSGGLKETIMKPVFFSVVDGLLEGTSFGKAARRKGLTASRVIQECDAFSYITQNTISEQNGYAEFKNASDRIEDWGNDDNNSRKNFVRTKYENTYRMNQYKDKKNKETGSNKNMVDEYTGERNITPYRDDPDQRRNDPKHDYQAEPDHIVPLKVIHSRLKGNYALSDEDIKRIANADENLAVTSARINGRKRHLTNKEFIEQQEKNKKEGKDYVELDEKTKKQMLAKQEEAERNLEKAVNRTVITNLGDANKRNAIIDKAASDAANQSKDYAVGNIILYIIKPIYYECSDIFANGLKSGVGADSVFQALKIRFCRVKKYVFENAKNFIGDNLVEFVKGFVSSLIEGVISLFVGVFKRIFKVAKEGIKILVQSGKVLFGENSHNMTAAEKGDAIVKILGGSAMAIVGVGIEFLLNKIGIGEPWSIILSTMLSGIAGALLMYALDQIDLFSVKSERRRNRICEIFEARINDTKVAAAHLDFVAIETLRRQRIGFENISNVIEVGVENDNIATINNGFYRMAEFFRVELPYSNTEEFCCYMESDVVLKL